MPEVETWLRCAREVILDAEMAFHADRQWRGKPMIGFRRWMGMDDRLHAVVVLADGTRVLLDEDETPRAGPRKGSERDFPYRWY